MKIKMMPTQLVISLFDPGMTPLLRAGLGGLAATLYSLQKGTWPASIEVGPGIASVEKDRVVITFGGKHPVETLRALFGHAFQLKNHVIYLPGSYDPNTFPDLTLRVAQQKALKRTLLQHGQTTRGSQTLSTTFTIDDEVVNEEYTGYASFIHQEAARLDEMVQALSGARVPLAGWAHPGAICLHEGFRAVSQWTYTAEQALCGFFSLVGCLSFAVAQGGSGVLVIPEPADLVLFAEARGLMGPRTPLECYVGGQSDAVIAASTALWMASRSLSLAVSSFQGVLFGETPWMGQQKTRVGTLDAGVFPDAVLRLYKTVSSNLPMRFRVHKPTKGAVGYFVVASVLRSFVAENIANGRRWYHGFATAKTGDKVARYVHYYRTRDNLGALAFEEREGLIAMLKSLEESEQKLVESVHVALRQRFGAIAAESPNQATMQNRFQGEREKWRLAFFGAKTHDQIRSALADLWSRAGSNKALQSSWRDILPLLQPKQWQGTRDLALVALASYQGSNEVLEG